MALTRKKRVVFATTAVALSVCFGLLLLEIAMRIFLVRRGEFIDSLHEQVSREWGGELTLFDMVQPSGSFNRVYELIPGANGAFVGQPLLINSAGFRDPERTVQKPPGVKRVAVLGDSVAFGWGVREEDRFSNVLEKLLNEQTTSTTKWEVLNFAVPGYNTVMEYATWWDKVMLYKPDVLLLSLVDNDDELPNFVRIRPQAWSLTRCFIYETIRDQLIGRKLGDTARLAAGGVAEAGGVGHASNVAGFRPELVPPEYRFLMGEGAMRSSMAELAKEARMHNATPLCVVHRVYEKPTGEAAGVLDSDRLVPMATQAGFQVIDPGPAILKYLEDHHLPDAAVYVRTNDVHPNPTVHKIIAEQIAPIVKQL